MKSLKTKIATVFSFICLALSMAVFGVFSAINIQNDTNGQLGYIDKTCYIQDSSGSRTFYSTIEKAYASATDGDTICVFEDISLSADSADFSVEKNISLMAVSSDVTLNLSGHNIVIGSGNTLTLGGGSNTLTLSSSSNNTIQNAGTLNVYGGIISSAEITNMGKLTFFGGQVDTIANTGLVTLSQSAQIKTIQTTQQTAGETDAGIFVSSNFVATSPIELSVSGTPTPGQQVAYFQESADAQNFADYFTLTNSGYFLHTSDNSLLIGQYITPPTVSGQSTFIYDGTLKTLQFSGLTSLMSVSGNTQTNAGDYTATVSLTNKTNYRWSDTRDSNDKTFSWSIDPAQLDYPTVEQDEFTYNTQAHSLVFSGLNNVLMAVSGTTSATNVGNYTAIVSLKDKQNYTWANNSTADYEIDWSIIKAQLTKPTAGTNSFTYTGDQITYTPSGYSSATMTISGNTGKAVDDYTASVSIRDTANYEWTGGTTTPVSLTWHITPKTLTKPTISGGPFTYDGNVKSVTINGFDANTMNREQYSATNARTYTARVSLKDKVNYTWADGRTDDVTYSWTINKRQLTIPAANPASYTYTGSAISVTFTNPDSAHITLGGDLTATVVGSYTATATIKDTANNEWTDGTTSVKNIVWSITKADLPTPTGLNWTVSSDKSTVTAKWNSVAHASSYTVTVYVGSTLALTKSGLTSTSYTFTASEFNNLSEGTYTFRVQAMGDSNYNNSSTATSGNLYRLVYMTNYGTSTVHARQYYTQGQSISAPNVLIRVGYTFGGWATTNNASSANLPQTATASDTYYAVWKLNTYSISYNTNSGSWTSGYNAPSSYTFSSTQGVSLPTASNITRGGYTFSNWSVTYTFEIDDWTDGFINLDTGEFVEYSSQYSNSVYSTPIYLSAGVTYTLNNGSSEVRWRVFDFEGNYQGSLSSNSTYTPEENCVAYILFYNGATDTQKECSITSNSSVTSLPAYFMGNILLIANWTARQYNITLIQNSGTGGSINTATYNTPTSKQTRTLTNPTRAGYTFGGWTVSWTDSTHSSTLPTVSGTTLTIPANCYGNITLTAKWDIIEYTITYTGSSMTVNGGKTQTYTVETDLTLRTATKVGATFDGWTVHYEEGTTTASWTDGEIISSNSLHVGTGNYGNIELALRYTYNTWTVIFDGNGRDIDVDPVEIAFNSNLQSAGLSAMPSVPGVTGWYKNAAGSGSAVSIGTQFNAGGGFVMDEDARTFTLYAKWRNITIVYHDEMAGNSNAQTVYGNSVTLPNPSVEGYNFQGWYAEENGQGTKYGNGGASYTVLIDSTPIHMYAYYTPATYTLTANANSGTIQSTSGWTGSGSSATKQIVYLSQYGTLPKVYRTNYIFNGWFTAPTSGTQVSASTTITGNTTIYAQWTAAAVYNTTRNLGYSDLTTAISGATAGDTLVVLKNITTSTTYTVNKNLTILANSAVTVSGGINVTAGALTLGGGSNTLTIANAITLNGGDLTVKNGTSITGGNVTYSTTVTRHSGIGVLNANSTVTITGGNVHGDLYGIRLDGGEVIISGGTVTSDMSNVDANGIFVIEDALLQLSGSATVKAYNALNIRGTLTMTGGTVTGTNAGLYIQANGECSVSGGTITADNAIYSVGTKTNSLAISGNVEITGNSSGINNTSSGTVTISGGTISATADDGIGINNLSNGSVTISGTNAVSITAAIGIQNGSEDENGFSIGSGTLTITNSNTTITATQNAIINYSTSASAVNISGGTYTSTATSYVTNDEAGLFSRNGTVTISGNASFMGYTGIFIDTFSRLIMTGGSATGTNLAGIYFEESALTTGDYEDESNRNILTDVTITASGTAGNALYIYDAFVEINDITLVNNSTASTVNGIYTLGGDAMEVCQVVINGATIIDFDTGIYNWRTLTVNDVTITSTLTSDITGIFNEGGEISIVDATISLPEQGSSIAIHNSSSGIVNISGGDYTGFIALGNSGTADITGGIFYGDQYGIANDEGTLYFGGNATTTGIVGIYIGYNANQSKISNVTISDNATITGDDGIIIESGALGSLTINGSPTLNCEWASCDILNQASVFEIHISGSPNIGSIYNRNGDTLYLAGTPTITQISSRASQSMLSTLPIHVNGTFTPTSPIELSPSSCTNNYYVVSYSNSSYSSSWASHFYLDDKSCALSLYDSRYLRIVAAIVTNTTKLIGYSDFQLAIDEADNNDELVIISDITAAQSGTIININKNLTINTHVSHMLRWYDINVTSGTLTLGGGSAILTAYIEIEVSQNGSLIINDNVSLSDYSYDFTIYNRGTTIINGGNIDSSEDAIGGSGGTITINGGTIEGRRSIDNNGATITIAGGQIEYPVYNYSGTIIVEEGAIINYSVYNEGGTIDMRGGTINASGSYQDGIENSYCVSVSGGSITGGQYGIYNTSTSTSSITLSGASSNAYSISGGTYDIYNRSTGIINVSGYIPSSDLKVYLGQIPTTDNEAYIYLADDVSGGMIRVYFSGWETADSTVGPIFSTDTSVDSTTDHVWVGNAGEEHGHWSTNLNRYDAETDRYYHSWDGCFDENTWVYYWDEKKKKIRRKRAKNVKFKDKLLVWNFDKGCFDFVNPLFIQRTEIADKYTEIKFSDGTKLNIIGDHAVYNAEDRYFRPIVSNERYGSPVGTKVMKYDGSIVTIVSKKTIHKKIAYTNIITKYHMNCFTNGILTSTPFNNMYRIDENMKYIPDESKRCHMLSLLDGIDKEYIEGLRLMEYPDRVLLNSPKNAGCKSFKEYIDKKLGVQKDSD